MLRIIDNYISEEALKDLQTFLLSDEFPWSFSSGTAYAGTEDIADYHFYHYFIVNQQNTSPYMPLIGEVLNRLNPGLIKRVRANLVTYTGEHRTADMHIDQNNELPCPFYIGLFYINDNNGYTMIGEERVDVKANRMVIYEDVMHCGVSQTDTTARLVLNINFIPRKEMLDVY